jgi:hypothetical protein
MYLLAFVCCASQADDLEKSSLYYVELFMAASFEQLVRSRNRN